MTYNIERRKMLGMALKAARQGAGLSASAASALIAARGLKCSRGTLLAWERGVGRTSREPFCSDLNLIAAVYQCSINDFFTNALEPSAANGQAATVDHSDVPTADGHRVPAIAGASRWDAELAGTGPSQRRSFLDG